MEPSKSVKGLTCHALGASVKVVAPVLLLVAAVAASGCSDACAPLLDVRHCTDDSTRCRVEDPADARAWDASWDARWPDVGALVRSLPQGEHGHERWDEARAEAWWADAGFDDPAAKEAYFTWEGGLYRVRVLVC